ncbi:polysaccharide deacetylase family protein [Streptomyces sp. NPDC047000]|uniref:polysaccharide deacetylase family protein n=1 Tax=Streptomyces sp. NPDC047000 TaxID=3155474 RepID=UPI0033E6F3B3
MKKDQMLTRRRVLLGGATTLGAAGAGAAGLLLTGSSGTPAARPAAPAAGPQARVALRPSAYRLQPLTGYGPPHAAPAPLAVRQEAFVRMPGRGRTILLTFDDGPDPRYTPKILDTLARYGVHATFFVCGEQASENLRLLGRMADEGHIVGNHTWSHPLLTAMSRDGISSEMTRTSKVIESGYGEPPRWFRAPYGAWNRTVFRLGAELGMEPLAWTVDTNDWATPGTGSIVRSVENGAAPGVVVLSHDAGGDRSQSVQALSDYLPRLLDSGYHLTVPRRNTF